MISAPTSPMTAPAISAALGVRVFLPVKDSQRDQGHNDT
jgi:hypothetical protein